MERLLSPQFRAMTAVFVLCSLILHLNLCLVFYFVSWAGHLRENLLGQMCLEEQVVEAVAAAAVVGMEFGEAKGCVVPL